MTTPRPENWEELAAGYALGDLSLEEAAELAQLLEAHPELTTEVAAFQKTLSLVPTVALKQKPAAHLRERVLTAMATPSVSQSRSIDQTRSRFPWGIAGTIAALTLFVLGLDSWRLRQELGRTQQALQQAQRELRESRATVASLQRSRPRLFQLAGAGTAQAASGRALIPPQTQEMLLAVNNLPPLPTGEVYRVWAFVDSNPKPIFCGQFETDAQGKLAKGWKMPQPVADSQVAQLVITSENASAPPIPAGTKVMESIL